MRVLARSLVVVLPAFVAGLLARLFLLCQPERSILAPAGTKVCFSFHCCYVLILQPKERRVTLWQTNEVQP
jgi:hypothetical protein